MREAAGHRERLPLRIDVSVEPFFGIEQPGFWGFVVFVQTLGFVALIVQRSLSSFLEGFRLRGLGCRSSFFGTGTRRLVPGWDVVSTT